MIQLEGQNSFSEPGSSASEGTTGTKDPKNCIDNCLAQPSVTPRIARLTHTQWENSVRDLLKLDDLSGLSSNFISDVSSESVFQLVNDLTITESLWDEYRNASETLAEEIASDSDKVSKLLPLNSPDQDAEKMLSFIEHFGRRVYRRTLTSEEIQSYNRFYQKAPDLLEAPVSFEASVGLLLRVFLQSPHFLYRVETSTQEEEIVPLNGFERASRLSFSLWNTIPDETLLDAAENGLLDEKEGVSFQVDRMMKDERFLQVILALNNRYLFLKDFRQIEKDADLYPLFHEGLPEMMKKELQLFLINTIQNDDGSISDLLNSTKSFVNADLAKVYGLEGDFDADFVPVELDAKTRPGFLTRLGFLSLNATNYEAHSIRRGVWINHHLLCSNLGDPPDNFETPIAEGKTNRERVDSTTKACGGSCHSIFINPVGFAFENYDAMGRFRLDDEDGYTIDSSGSSVFDGVQNWTTPKEFMTLLAQSEQVPATQNTSSSFSTEEVPIQMIFPYYNISENHLLMKIYR